ncbi:MAG: hypothetical protein ACRCVT_10545 [Leadbetterella sp.]
MNTYKEFRISTSLKILTIVFLTSSLLHAQTIRTRTEPFRVYPTLENADPSLTQPTEEETNLVGAAYSAPGASPEASRANSLQNIPVNLYTGSPVINIPLATLQEGRLAVPLSLTYAHNQVKPHTVSGWTGLGWELSGIPVISRMVRGYPDEGNLINNVGTKGFYRYGNDLSSQDREPDYFFVHTPSGSHKFMFDAYGKAHFFPEADIRVQILVDNHPQDTGPNQYAKIFRRFTITFPDGMAYIFSKSNTEESAEIETQTAINNGIYPLGSNFLNFLTNASLPSSWYCEKIRSPYGEEINFDYDRVAYTYYKLAENTASGVCPTSVVKKINKVYVRGSQISTITSTHQKIAFNTGIKNCTVDYSVNPPDTICTLVGGTRYDIDSWGNAPTGSSASKILLSIDVSDNEPNPTIKSSFSFNYDYFTGADYGLPSGYTYAQVGTTHQKRLKLKKISFPDGSEYSLGYDSENGNIQNRFSFGVDHWGYANGAESNLNSLGLIGTDYYTSAPSCGSNKTTNLTETKKGVLNRISHSLGNETAFEYESHTANNYADPGGLRIKYILHDDRIRNYITRNNYFYETTGGSTSGFMFVKPTYRIANINTVSASSELYNTLIAESSRPVIGYARVQEMTVSGNQLQVLGSTISTFDQTEVEGDIKQPTACTSCIYNPVYFKLQHDFRQGQVLSQESYNATGTLINKMNMAYTANGGIKYDSVYCTKSFASVIGGSSNLTYNYYQYFRKHRIESQSSTQYSRSGIGSAVVQTTNYTYKDEMPSSYKNIYKGMHNQVVKTTSNDEDNNVLEEIIKYTADFGFDQDTTLVCDPDCGITPNPCSNLTCLVYQITEHVPAASSYPRAIQENKDRNILYAPIETQQKRNGVTISASYQNYHPILAGNTFAIGLPYYSFILKKMPKSNFQEVYFQKIGDLMVTDPDYGASVSEYTNYNSKGLPEVARTRYGPVHSTTYNTSGLLPLIQSQNAAIAPHSTSITYGKVFRGIEKETLPNALENKYSYNVYDNQVEIVRDKFDRIRKRSVDDLIPTTTAPSSIIWNNALRTKQCSSGQITLTVYITGLLAGATAQFSTDGGNTWQNANVGSSGYAFTLSPTNTYQSFMARSSDNLTNIISTQYHASCSTSPPLTWGSYTVNSAGNGICNYYVSVTGLATDSYAEFSSDNTNWFRANVGDYGMNFALPTASGLQTFWFRPSDSPQNVTFGTTPTCNP